MHISQGHFKSFLVLTTVLKKIVNSLLFYLLTCKLRRLKIYVFKGEKSLLEEMVIDFTQLLLFKGMKQATRNTRRSVGGVPVCFKKI